MPADGKIIASEVKPTSGLITLNGNVLAVVDTETTGLIAGYHDLVQICILPLNSDLDPLEGVSPFYMNMKPEHPERASRVAMRINGLDLDKLKRCPTKVQVADALDVWFKGLNLPLGKKLVFLTQNAPFDLAFLKDWLGQELFEMYFQRRGRDTMFAANFLNDRAAFQCQPVPFPSVSLESLCNQYGISNDGAHDALSDCIRTGKVYREMLRSM